MIGSRAWVWATTAMALALNVAVTYALTTRCWETYQLIQQTKEKRLQP